MASDSRFVWTDLSTYDVDEAKRFYQKTFGWDFYTSTEGMDDEYFIARKGGDYLAGLYLLPEVFQKKNFPSFWMPYIQTEDIHKTVELAKTFDQVKVEIEPMALEDGSFISLIRDSLGAGFTVYQGGDLGGEIKHGHGLPVWNELHLSDLSRVRSFYESLFNWEIRPMNKKGEALISLSDGEAIGNIYELPDAFRGGYEYWIQTFEVDNMKLYIDSMNKSGGAALARLEGGRVMVRDSQDASFIVKERK